MLDFYLVVIVLRLLNFFYMERKPVINLTISILSEELRDILTFRGQLMLLTHSDDVYESSINNVETERRCVLGRYLR